MADDALHMTLGLIADAARHFADPWWIIGSAAARLSGAAIDNVADVDILASLRDGERLIELWGGAAPAKSSAQFRSKLFARFDTTPLPVEAMAEFDMLIGGVWLRVQPATRIETAGVFIPSVEEQIEILAMMARPKDARRAAALRAMRRVMVD